MHEKQRKSEMKKILFKKITNNPFGFCKATATAEDVVEAGGRRQLCRKELNGEGRRREQCGRQRKRNERILFMVLMSQAWCAQGEGGRGKGWAGRTVFECMTPDLKLPTLPR